MKYDTFNVPTSGSQRMKSRACAKFIITVRLNNVRVDGSRDTISKPTDRQSSTAHNNYCHYHYFYVQTVQSDGRVTLLTWDLLKYYTRAFVSGVVQNLRSHSCQVHALYGYFTFFLFLQTCEL